MATTNTTKSWFWYERKKGRNSRIGIIDENGNAPSTAGLTIDIWFVKKPVDVTNDDAIIEIPDEYLQAIAKGCVYEYLLMTAPNVENSGIDRFRADYEAAVTRGKRHVSISSKSPTRARPIDLNMY